MASSEDRLEKALGPNVLKQRKEPFTIFCISDGCIRFEEGAQKHPDGVLGCVPGSCEGCDAYRAVYFGFFVPGYVPPIDRTKDYKRTNM